MTSYGRGTQGRERLHLDAAWRSNPGQCLYDQYDVPAWVALTVTVARSETHGLCSITDTNSFITSSSFTSVYDPVYEPVCSEPKDVIMLHNFFYFPLRRKERATMARGDGAMSNLAT